MKRFPANLYVKIETPDHGPAYPICSENLTGLLIEVGDEAKVGVYGLLRTLDIEGVVNVIDTKKGKSK